MPREAAAVGATVRPAVSRAARAVCSLAPCRACAAAPQRVCKLRIPRDGSWGLREGVAGWCDDVRAAE
eukprot:7210982-Prymnesium_polylepis.1